MDFVSSLGHWVFVYAWGAHTNTIFDESIVCFVSWFVHKLGQVNGSCGAKELIALEWTNDNAFHT